GEADAPSRPRDRNHPSHRHDLIDRSGLTEGADHVFDPSQKSNAMPTSTTSPTRYCVSCSIRAKPVKPTTTIGGNGQNGMREGRDWSRCEIRLHNADSPMKK